VEVHPHVCVASEPKTCRERSSPFGSLPLVSGEVYVLIEGSIDIGKDSIHLCSRFFITNALSGRSNQ